MATFEIITDSKPYYTIKVSFDGQEFSQTIYSDKAGAELTNQLQAYANEYESSYLGALTEQ